MPIASVAGMSVYVQTAMEAKGVGRQNPGHGLNLRGGAGLDGFMFDSLIDNFMTEEIGRRRLPEQAARKTERPDDRQYMRKAEEPGGAQRDSEISGPEKIRTDSQKPEKNSGPREQGNGNEYRQQDNYADECNKTVTHNPDTVKKDSASCADNPRQVKDGANELKISGLLLKCAGRLSDDSADARTGKVTGQPAGNADAVAEKGLKAFNHVEGAIDRSKGAANKENTRLTDNAKNLLKTTVPADMPKNSNSGQTDTLTAAIKDLQSLSGDQARMENGLKTGHTLQEKTNESPGVKGINIEEMIRHQIQIKTSGSGDAGSGDRDMLKLSGKGVHTAGQHLMRQQFQLQEAVTATAGNNSARILSGMRLVSEFAGNLNREGGSSNYSKAARSARGHGGTGLTDTGMIASGGGRGKNIQHAAKAARPPAFNDVIDRIVYIAKGNNRLGVTVENETVGKLNINVTLNKGVINVHINAADNATREFVQNNIQHIVDSLAKSGVSVGGFSVGLRNHKDGEGSENRYAYDNGNAFDVDGRHENAYPEPAGNAARSGSGMISVFA
ncbi:MAG: flagellar hook-length control protein FliK [Deferribacteres bacterium]|nr:flagellar hook-length control protein FliK [Deferribacteres bacterium]